MVKNKTVKLKKRKSKNNWATINKIKTNWITDILETEDNIIEHKINDKEFEDRLKNIRENYQGELDYFEGKK